MDDRPERWGARWGFGLGAAVGVCLTAIVAGIIIWSPWSGGDDGSAPAVQADASVTQAATSLLPSEAEAATLDHIYSKPFSGIPGMGRSEVIARWVDRGFEMVCAAEDQESDRWIVECSAEHTSFNPVSKSYNTRTIDQWGIFEVAPDSGVVELTVYCEEWTSEPATWRCP